MAVQFIDYVQLLRELEQTLRDLTALQPEKIAAVRAHDLEVLNDCMKREQAASLALRGLEQKRANMAKALGVDGVPIRQVAGHCPESCRGDLSHAVESLIRRGQELRSAQDAARAVVESDLRRVNGELERRGVATDPEEGAQPAVPPRTMRTDIRA